MTWTQESEDRIAAEVAAGSHHPDCDGWRMHHVTVEWETRGMFFAACPVCGPLHTGTASSEATARAMGAGHEQSIPCAGECQTWDLEEAAR